MQALLTLAYGEYATKKSNAFERDWWFKEGQGNEKDNKGSGQPKMQRTYADVGKVRTFMRLDRGLGLRLIAEELNLGIVSEEKTRTLAWQVDSPP
jgi:hypothetical protein